MLISIIIVNFNTAEHITKCLNSLQSVNDENNYEIIIVDNNSGSDDIKKLESNANKAKIIYNKTNVGFGSACNIGASYATGKYLLFLNPDAEFVENVFTELISLLEADQSIGIATCSLIDDEGNLTYTFNNFLGLKYELTESFGVGTHSDILKKNNHIKQNKDRVFETDWVIGAFMFIRRTEFEKVKGFDENFFLYYEDTDLCKKIKDNGNKIIVVPYLKVVHTQMSSVRSVKGENIFYYHLNRSNLIYAYKHFSFIGIILTRVFHIIGYTTRLTALSFRKRFIHKRELKHYQYLMIIKLYFSSYKNILSNKYKTFKDFDLSNEGAYEEFWKK